jgi:hypothetical protein
MDDHTEYSNQTRVHRSILPPINGLLPNEQNFDLDKSRQTFHYDLKEHHKISNIPKFRCEML